jgi:hypothetical protein
LASIRPLLSESWKEWVIGSLASVMSMD